MRRVRCVHADGSETVREFPTALLAYDFIRRMLSRRGDAVECTMEEV